MKSFQLPGDLSIKHCQRFLVWPFVLTLVILVVSTSPASAASERKILENDIQPLLATHPGQSGAYVLEKGEEALLARAWLTEHAAKSIDIQYFIWSSDNIGTLAAEALLSVSERGLRVRVLVDDLLIDAPPEPMIALALHPNIEIRIYNPLHSVGTTTLKRFFNLATRFRSANQRMHDKVAIFDQMVAITGGRNMADEYFDFSREYNFRDRDMLLVGPVTADMTKSFERFWKSKYSIPVENLLKEDVEKLTPAAVNMIYAELHAYARNKENFAPEVRQALVGLNHKFAIMLGEMAWGDIRFLCDLPGKNDGNRGLSGGGRTTDELVEAVQRATKRLTIQSPYLILPEGGLVLLKALIEKGVAIRIVTNSLAATDNLQALSGYANQREKILKAGIEVYEFKPDPAVKRELIERYPMLEKHSPIFALHAKTMVIDGETLYVGTFNLDPRSANLNTEVGVLLHNEAMAIAVERSIEREMLPENSWNGADNPDQFAPFTKRLQMHLWRMTPLEPLL